MRKSIRDAILAETNAAKSILDTVEREERDLTDAEREQIDGHMNKATDLQKNAEKERAFREQMTDLGGSLGLGEDPENIPPPPPAGKSTKNMTVGEMFTKSAEYQTLINSVPNGSFGEKYRVHSNPMHVGSMKTLLTSGNHTVSGGITIETDHRGLLSPFYERPLSVRALFASGSTTSDTIDYVRMINTVNNAGVVPEATTTAPIDGTTVTNAMGGLKPESGFTFQRDSTTVKTIAHWMPITKRALSDVAQIRTMIDTFLRYGLEEEFEDQLLTGSGTGENFLGLNNTPGIQTQTATGAQDALDVTRLARTKVRIGGRATPTAFVMNPLDWQNVELLRNLNGDFYGGGPFQLTTPRLWGLPVVESEAVAPKTAWCAAWNWGVVYDREQATVTATDSHADFFVRNLVAILAEMRAAFAVLRPSAFVKITLP
jgi:HK97 family phage major capsid protein